MGLMSAVEQLYPRARWPTPTQIRGYGAWGGVAAATIFYVIQPWDWIASFSKKEE